MHMLTMEGYHIPTKRRKRYMTREKTPIPDDNSKSSANVSLADVSEVKQDKSVASVSHILNATRDEPSSAEDFIYEHENRCTTDDNRSVHLHRHQKQASQTQQISELYYDECSPVHSVRNLHSTLSALKSYIQLIQTIQLDMAAESRIIRLLAKRCCAELIFLMCFCGVGGILFKIVEGSFESYYKCGVKRIKRDFINNLWTKSHSLSEDQWKHLARNRLHIFENELHAAHEAGMKTYSGQKSWGFLNSVLYSLTIVTTIGYGHMYPDTRTGKILTIIYAIIGIPLFLLALTDFGKLFTRCIKYLWSFVRRLYYTGSCRKVRRASQVQDIFKGAQMVYDLATFRRSSTAAENLNNSNAQQYSTDRIETPITPALSNFEVNDEFNLPISLAIVILIIYILCGALIYCLWEGWQFLDSFYFVFISMSTIGFGDMVPNDAACMIVTIVYLVFGLALTSMCINVVQVKLSDTFQRASEKIGTTIGFSEDIPNSIP